MNVIGPHYKIDNCVWQGTAIIQEVLYHINI